MISARINIGVLHWCIGELYPKGQSYVPLVPIDPCVHGVSKFLFSIASRDVEVEVFRSWLDSIDHDPNISFQNRTAMNCPTLDRHFSNAVCDQFDLFPLLIQKLAGCPHGEVIHRVMFLVRTRPDLPRGRAKFNWWSV